MNCQELQNFMQKDEWKYSKRFRRATWSYPSQETRTL